VVGTFSDVNVYQEPLARCLLRPSNSKPPAQPAWFIPSTRTEKASVKREVIVPETKKCIDSLVEQTYRGNGVLSNEQDSGGMTYVASNDGCRADACGGSSPDRVLP
jgi:hypothetical protein